MKTKKTRSLIASASLLFVSCLAAQSAHAGPPCSGKTDNQDLIDACDTFQFWVEGSPFKNVIKSVLYSDKNLSVCVAKEPKEIAAFKTEFGKATEKSANIKRSGDKFMLVRIEKAGGKAPNSPTMTKKKSSKTELVFVSMAARACQNNNPRAASDPVIDAAPAAAPQGGSKLAE